MAQSPARPKPGTPTLLQGDPSSLPAALRGLINNPQFSDVTFVVGKEQRVVHAHRCILACRCKVFHGMFCNQLKETNPCLDLQVPFVLADMHPDVFLALLEFLYTNTVTLSSAITLEVLTSAVEYGLDSLRKLCVDFISKSLTVDLACEALQAAVTYGQTDLMKKCLSFIECHTTEIIQTQSYRELSDLGLVNILQSNQLSIDEVPLIHAVREWSHVSSAVLDLPVSVVAMDVVKELRLFLLSPEELTLLEKENRQDELIPESQIAQAWICHALKRISDLPRRGTAPRDHHRYLQLPSK
ncbi:BTB/POZ domain-containing protein 19 [Pelodytes ibericus]